MKTSNDEHLNWTNVWNVLRDLLPFLHFKKALACNFNKSNTPPWVFHVFELYKWY